MPTVLDPQLRRALAERMRYYHELGFSFFYSREPRAQEVAERVAVAIEAVESSPTQPELREEMSPRKSAAVAAVAEENIFAVPKPEQNVSDPVAALKLIRQDLGDCTRCK